MSDDQGRTVRDHTAGGQPPRVVIVGGGISGLAIAHALVERQLAAGIAAIEVCLLEAGAEPGGKIRSERSAGYLCEWGPNGFLNKEPATLSLCRRLGLTAQLQPAEDAFGRRYIYRRGRLVAVRANPLGFIASPLLPPAGKLRLFCEPFVPRRRALRHEGDESVASFARRRIGSWGAEILIDAMQSGIYAGDPTRLSVKSCFPRVVEVEQQYGSLVRGMVSLKRSSKGGATPGAGPSGHLTSFNDGLQSLTNALAARLGSRVRCNTTLRAIQRRNQRYQLELDGGEPLQADAVVLACPAYAAAPLLAPLDGHLSRLIDGIEYAPLGVLCLGWRREQVKHPLDGFGFLAPRREGLRSLGALFSSSIFRGRAPFGRVLMRVMLGGARDPQVLELDDDHLVLLALSELEPVLGLNGMPEHVRVFRHTRAIPQYNVGHEARIQRIAQRLADLPHLHLGGNAYHGVSINDCVRNAEVLATQIIADLEASPLALPAS